MNADDLVALVQRARESEPVAAPPPRGLVQRGRAAGRRRRAAILGTSLVVGAIAAGSVLTARYETSGSSSPPAGAPVESGTRLVGADGVVIAVPAHWSTYVEQGSTCGPASPDVVTFFLRLPGAPIGSCAVRIGASFPAEDTLIVATGSLLGAEETPAGPPAGRVAQMSYYLSDAPHSGPGAARMLKVPSAAVEFTVTAATAAEADAILRTVRPTPDGEATVAITTAKRLYEPPVLESDPGAPLSSTTVEVAGSGGYGPGYLLRTDPPVGTPVPIGSTVTLVMTAGDLDAVVTPDALAAEGWAVTPAETFDPPIGRQQAFRLAVHDPHARGGTYGISLGGDRGEFLRQLDGVLVWLVAYQADDTSKVRLTAIDAQTGRVLSTHVFPAVTR